MIDDEKHFEELFSKIKFDEAPDYNHRDRLEKKIISALTKPGWQNIPPLLMWKTIMNSQMTKLACAAAIILIFVFSAIAVKSLITPAWAVEDTTKALNRYNAVYISGLIKTPSENSDEKSIWAKEGLIPCEIWAEANERGTSSGNTKLKTIDGHIKAVYNNETYIYESTTNTVRIKQGQHFRIKPWFIGQNAVSWYKRMHKGNVKIIYGTDGSTGRYQAFMTFISSSSSTSYQSIIDLETNLPVSIKQWNNGRCEGTPVFNAQKIVYFMDLPDEIFMFEIPEGATVIREN